MSVGGSFTFSEGDTLEQQINDPVYYQFISAVMESSGIDPISAQPTNLQDSWSNMINLSSLNQFQRICRLCLAIPFQECITRRAPTPEGKITLIMSE